MGSPLYRHWLEFSPSVKLLDGYVDFLGQSHHQHSKWVEFQFWLNCPFKGIRLQQIGFRVEGPKLWFLEGREMTENQITHTSYLFYRLNSTFCVAERRTVKKHQQPGGGHVKAMCVCGKRDNKTHRSVELYPLPLLSVPPHTLSARRHDRGA